MQDGQKRTPLQHLLSEFIGFIIRYVCVWMHTQSCLTLCDPMDCSPPGFSVHGIFQARVLDWVAVSFSRGTSWPRDRTVSLASLALAVMFFTSWGTGEAPSSGVDRTKSNVLVLFLSHCTWTPGGILSLRINTSSPIGESTVLRCLGNWIFYIKTFRCIIE